MYSQELFDVQDLLTVFDRPISYHKCLAEMCGSVTAGVMLSQMIYWTPRTSDGDRWFYKNMDEWQKETALTRTEQESARKKLKSLGILEEKKEGVPCKLFFRVDLKQLAKCLNLFNSPVCRNAANKDESSLQTGKQVSRKQASRNLADNLYTEITTEITDIRANEFFAIAPSSLNQENCLPAQTTPKIEEPPKPQSPFSPAAPENIGKAIAISKQADQYKNFGARFAQDYRVNRKAPLGLQEEGLGEWHLGSDRNNWKPILIKAAIAHLRDNCKNAPHQEEHALRYINNLCGKRDWSNFEVLAKKALDIETTQAIATQSAQQQPDRQPTEDRTLMTKEEQSEMHRKALEFVRRRKMPQFDLTA